jgi:hypothetical protein
MSLMEIGRGLVREARATGDVRLIKCAECSYPLGEVKAGKFHFESYAAADTVEALCACGHLTVVDPGAFAKRGRSRSKRPSRKSTCTSERGSACAAPSKERFALRDVSPGRPSLVTLT